MSTAIWMDYTCCIKKAYLVVDQAPLFQERVDTHNRADISSEVSATSSDCEVFNGVQSVCVDHKISVVFISSRRLAAITAVEELCERLLLDRVDNVHVEPAGVAGEDNGMGLGDELVTS